MLKNAHNYTNEEVSNRAEKFNVTVMSACGSPTLIKIQKKLSEQCQRYRELWWQEDLNPDQLEKAHNLIIVKVEAQVECILNRDIKSLKELINKDFDQFLRMYLQFLNSYLSWLKTKDISFNN